MISPSKRGIPFCYHYSLLYEYAFLYDWLSPPLLGRFWRHLASAAHPCHGERVLDLCCGPGYLASLLASSGARVTGVDLLPQMLRRARRKKGLFALARSSAHRLPFRDGAFDTVTLSLALHEMPAPVRRQVLGKIRRVLRERGRLVLGELCPPPAGGGSRPSSACWKTPRW